MHESEKREPRLILPQTEEVVDVHKDDEERGVGVIGTSDYIANVAKAWAEARKKRDG